MPLKRCLEKWEYVEHLPVHPDVVRKTTTEIVIVTIAVLRCTKQNARLEENYGNLSRWEHADHLPVDPDVVRKQATDVVCVINAVFV